jgi:hypothetical protein
VDECVDEQLFEGDRRDLGHAGAVHAAPCLHLAQVAHHEGERVVEDATQGAREVLRVVILRRVDVGAWVLHRLDNERRLEALRQLGDQQEPREVEHAVVGREVHVREQAQAVGRTRRKLLAVGVAKEVAEAKVVEGVDARIRRQLVGVELVGDL